ncbi:GH32 C-terminal domain-containing protein [Streptomyces sp. NBC_01235]|uniref:GH32 C-terminal domain-containing protein n=1 Tax=Streptomyces sp. NBC_01235 TaxID=2903788 RepID=UPI002E10F1F9|nr:GH32 C-terminal domain-containing protein [Streptomyces sp. NBC_01235]
MGYDTTTQELYVDRPNSGAADFSSDFPGVQRAPLRPRTAGPSCASSSAGRRRGLRRQRRSRDHRPDLP